jgi:hypothetical protein
MNEGGDRILRLTAELAQARKERDAWEGSVPVLAADGAPLR